MASFYHMTLKPASWTCFPQFVLHVLYLVVFY